MTRSNERNTQETAPEQNAKADLIEIEVRDRTVHLKSDWRDDYEVMVMIGQLDRGNPTVVPPLMEHLLGEEESALIASSLRSPDGTIHVSDVTDWILELFKAANAKN